MTLVEMLGQLDTFEDQTFICARRPLSAHAECTIVPIPADCTVPADVVESGLAYFLEVHTAREVLEVVEHASEQERIRVLLYYAEHDAWPRDAGSTR